MGTDAAIETRRRRHGPSRLWAAAWICALGLVACSVNGPSSTPASPSAPPRTPVVTPSPSYRLIDVDGRHLAIDCRGNGDRTVLLIGGLGVLSRTWDGVLGALETDPVRVCRFDRPGLGLSDSVESARTAANLTREIVGLLEASGESGPFVVVGQSLGGLLAQYLIRTKALDVRGAVFLDAIHPDLDVRLEPLLSTRQVNERREELGLNQENITFDAIVEIEDEVRNAPTFPPIPLAVLRHGVPFETTDPDWPAGAVEDLWADLQEDLSRLSAESELIVATRSGHRIHESEPDLVADAIRWVVGHSGS
jgi:pimeloyl-ACP methyl ester carboxylesterase